MEDKQVYRDGEEADPVAHVTIGGRKYRLQHPGIEIWLDWKAKQITVSYPDGKKPVVRQDHVSIFKLFLHHSVHCVSEDDFKLTMGNMHLRNQEEWSDLCSTFLTGEYDEKPEGSTDGSGENDQGGPVAETQVAGNTRGRGKKKRSTPDVPGGSD